MDAPEGVSHRGAHFLCMSICGYLLRLGHRIPIDVDYIAAINSISINAATRQQSDALD